MRRFLLIFAANIIASMPLSAQEVAERCERHAIFDQGIEREYYLYRPEGLKKDAPLLIVLHGYGSSALKCKTSYMALADKEGFAVCYAQGIKDYKGKAYWNVGYPFHKDIKTDDVEYLCRLVKHLQTKYNLSKKNTFLTGMSNGGEMCYIMAMKKPKVFGAIASIAGLTLNNMSRDYKMPIPFMEVHGTADNTSKWSGDPDNKGGWGSYLAVPVSISYLVAANRCIYEVSDTLPKKRNTVIRHRYKGGTPAWDKGPECEVWLYEIQGGGHTWAENDMDTSGETWRFFSKYLK